jgi:hypothetical protein
MTWLPARKDFTIFRGTLWNQVFTYATITNPITNTPIDLTGYQAVLAAKVNASDLTNAFEISSPSNGIVIDGSAGKITCNITPEQTAAINNDQLVYALYLIDPSNNPLPPLLQGILYFSPLTLPNGG